MSERIEVLERRLAELEQKGGGGSPGRGTERMLKFLPFFAFGNLFLSLPALAISIAVGYFSFVQAEATDKMQVASVWPRATFVTSNQGTSDGRGPIRLAVINKGVGPAIIRGMQIRYEGRPYVHFQDLLGACCASEPEKIPVGLSTIQGEVLRPGEETMFAMLFPESAPLDVYERFDAERLKLDVSTCYCSVFDDCWIETREAAEPRPVEQCPADWVQYTGFPQSAALAP
jgi:hypothetical protein